MLRLSFSQWENYNGCPRRWDFQSLQRLPRSAPGPAASRGLGVHAAIENYIQIPRGHPAAYPVAHYRDVLDLFRCHPNGAIYLENKLFFDPEWYAVPKDHPDRKWTIILDALRIEGSTGHIGEWKTGKPKDTHRDQRTLYTLATYRKYGVEEVVATTYYFDNTSEPQRLKSVETAVPKLIKIWDDRAYQMEHDDFRPPRPGFHCRWCDYARDKGGPCEFTTGAVEASKIAPPSKFVASLKKSLTPLSGPPSTDTPASS
jgi:hypothetical protein